MERLTHPPQQISCSTKQMWFCVLKHLSNVALKQGSARRVGVYAICAVCQPLSLYVCVDCVIMHVCDWLWGVRCRGERKTVAFWWGC